MMQLYAYTVGSCFHCYSSLGNQCNNIKLNETNKILNFQLTFDLVEHCLLFKSGAQPSKHDKSRAGKQFTSSFSGSLGVSAVRPPQIIVLAYPSNGNIPTREKHYCGAVNQDLRALGSFHFFTEGSL